MQSVNPTAQSLEIADEVADEVAAELKNLVQAFQPQHIEIHNFSRQHSRGKDTHYRLVMVSEQFSQQSKVKRHQLIYKAVAQLMPDPIHALVLDLYTLLEWQNREGKLADLPRCSGNK